MLVAQIFFKGGHNKSFMRKSMGDHSNSCDVACRLLPPRRQFSKLFFKYNWANPSVHPIRFRFQTNQRASLLVSEPFAKFSISTVRSLRKSTNVFSITSLNNNKLFPTITSSSLARQLQSVPLPLVSITEVRVSIL